MILKINITHTHCIKFLWCSQLLMLADAQLKIQSLYTCTCTVLKAGHPGVLVIVFRVCIVLLWCRCIIIYVLELLRYAHYVHGTRAAVLFTVFTTLL